MAVVQKRMSWYEQWVLQKNIFGNSDCTKLSKSPGKRRKLSILEWKIGKLLSKLNSKTSSTAFNS